MHWRVVYPVCALVCRRSAGVVYRCPILGGEGQLPILIYWNPPLPIFYPIPSRTDARIRDS